MGSARNLGNECGKYPRTVTKCVKHQWVVNECRECLEMSQCLTALQETHWLSLASQEIHPPKPWQAFRSVGTVPLEPLGCLCRSRHSTLFYFCIPQANKKRCNQAAVLGWRSCGTGWGIWSVLLGYQFLYESAVLGASVCQVNEVRAGEALHRILPRD